MEKMNEITGTNMTNTGGMGRTQFPITNMVASPQMASLLAYQLAYPEVYYILQPYIMIACDQMDIYGSVMPTQEMMDQMTNGIYSDVIRMYPDMSEYDGEAIPAVNMGNPNIGYGFGRRLRRRGPLRDIIGILLLSELFRRRRRYY